MRPANADMNAKGLGVPKAALIGAGAGLAASFMPSLLGGGSLPSDPSLVLASTFGGALGGACGAAVIAAIRNLFAR